MPLIAEELLIKLMAAAAVGGAATGGGIALNNYINNTPEKIEGRKVGLNCRSDGICELYGGSKITVKHVEGTSTTTGTLVSTPSSTGGKIKINRYEVEKEVKFFFSIEGGHISLKEVASDSSGVDKLEEFETYEIDKETVNGKEKHFLKRRTKVAEEVKKLLGLNDAGCSLPAGTENSQSTTCNLDVTKLGKIKFDGMNGSPAITESGSTATLTINELTDTEKGESGSVKYPLGYKFELSGPKQVTIPTGSGNIVKKANDVIEFKIKQEGRNLSLEKVWDVERLAWKLGFSDCKKETKTCSFPSTINLFKDDSNSVKNANVTEHSNKTITFEEGATDYNGGVKFTVATATAISGGEKKGSEAMENIEAASYEIKEQTVDNNKAWYLSKKG